MLLLLCGKGIGGQQIQIYLSVFKMSIIFVGSTATSKLIFGWSHYIT